jgi:hypothetical protein
MGKFRLKCDRAFRMHQNYATVAAMAHRLRVHWTMVQPLIDAGAKRAKQLERSRDDPAGGNGLQEEAR